MYEVLVLILYAPSYLCLMSWKVIELGNSFRLSLSLSVSLMMLQFNLSFSLKYTTFFRVDDGVASSLWGVRGDIANCLN